MKGQSFRASRGGGGKTEFRQRIRVKNGTNKSSNSFSNNFIKL